MSDTTASAKTFCPAEAAHLRSRRGDPRVRDGLHRWRGSLDRDPRAPRRSRRRSCRSAVDLQRLPAVPVVAAADRRRGGRPLRHQARLRDRHRALRRRLDGLRYRADAAAAHHRAGGAGVRRGADGAGQPLDHRRGLSARAAGLGHRHLGRGVVADDDPRADHRRASSSPGSATGAGGWSSRSTCRSAASALALLLWRVPNDQQGEKRRLDLVGAALVTAGPPALAWGLTGDGSNGSVPPTSHVLLWCGAGHRAARRVPLLGGADEGADDAARALPQRQLLGRQRADLCALFRARGRARSTCR